MYQFHLYLNVKFDPGKNRAKGRGAGGAAREWYASTESTGSAVSGALRARTALWFCASCLSFPRLSPAATPCTTASAMIPACRLGPVNLAPVTLPRVTFSSGESQDFSLHLLAVSTTANATVLYPIWNPRNVFGATLPMPRSIIQI